VPLDVAHVRAALGFGYDVGAAWFSIDEKDAKFAPQKTGKRAVVLRQWSEGPIVQAFARSRTSTTGIVNPPHGHRREFAACWLGDEGRIVVAVRLPLARSLFTDSTYMCAEPDEATIAQVLAAPCPGP
jgi:hypothetical protein